MVLLKCGCRSYAEFNCGNKLKKNTTVEKHSRYMGVEVTYMLRPNSGNWR